jgi:hypothetical protein
VLNNSHILFGNLADIYSFHSQLLPNFMEPAQHSVASLCQLFTRFKSHFHLYSAYCLNKPHSEEMWREHCANCQFFKTVQASLGLKLALDTYLLKPVQRVSKYQLILRELQKCCHSDDRYNKTISLPYL